MEKWSIPRNIKEFWGFLELTRYYQKFVANCGAIALPLTQLLKKGNFVWNPMAEEPFYCLKVVMVAVPVLALPNFKEPFGVETDASEVGVGAVLMQQKRPLAFFSQALPPTHHFKVVYKREFMAIVFAVRKWRPYLLGQKIYDAYKPEEFEIFTRATSNSK